MSVSKLTTLDLTAGASVFTADGERLGTVKQVAGADFKVDAPLERDYWLGRDFVIASSPERVTLSFNRDDLRAYKQAGPSATAAESDPTRDAVADTVSSEEEQLEQRERVARELADQRQHLPHAHPDGNAHAPPSTFGGNVGLPVEEELAMMDGQSPLQRIAAEARPYAGYIAVAVAIVALVALWLIRRD